MDIEAVRRIVMALPGVTVAPHHDKVSFRVGGKIFATVPPDEDLAQAAVLTHPDSLEELHWGRRLAGVRVRLADVDEGLARALLEEAHARRQPVRREGAKGVRPTQPVVAEDSATSGESDDKSNGGPQDRPQNGSEAGLKDAPQGEPQDKSQHKPQHKP